MSEKRLASEKTVQAFIRAVYPESTELCMTVNSEEDVLREATRLILGRRAPDPEKQELVEALRELYDARVDSDWLIIKGHDEDGHPLSREGVARKQARALLRRYPDEKS